MRKPKLTVDAFVAALAALALTQGCSKADRAAAEPPAIAPQSGSKAVDPTPGPQATTIAAPPMAAAPPPPPAVEGQPPAQQPARGAAATIDAGREMKKAAPKDGAQAACGAAGCSPDMKKKER